MNAVAALTAVITTLTVATSPAPRTRPFGAVVDRVAGMVSDQSAQSLAQAHGLQLLDVTWEDTGRSEGSSVGPNISDVTIEVVAEGGHKLALMPVLRFPNFSDRTADVKLDRIFLRVADHPRHAVHHGGVGGGARGRRGGQGEGGDEGGGEGGGGHVVLQGGPGGVNARGAEPICPTGRPTVAGPPDGPTEARRAPS